MKISNRATSGARNIAKRLSAYSAAAAATAVATQGTANAAEVVYDIADIGVVGTEFDLHFNVVSGATAAVGGVATNNTAPASFALFGHLRIYGPVGDTIAGFVGAGGLGTGYRYPDLLATSTNIGVSDAFAGQTSYAAEGYGNYGWLPSNTGGNWGLGRTGIVGLRFSFDDGGGGGVKTYYGWAQITITADAGGILHGFGYNNEAGEASHAVDTVDPSPVITSVEVSGTGLIVHFTGRDGVPYKLLESPDLVTPFSETGVTGSTTGGVGTMTYPGGAAEAKNFIRVAAD